LFETESDPAQAKVFGCGRGKIDGQIYKLHLAFKEKMNFIKCCKMHKHVPLFNHLKLNSVGAHLEANLKACKGFVGPLQALCLGQAASNQINWTKDSSSQSITDFSLESILHCKQYHKLIYLLE